MRQLLAAGGIATADLRVAPDYLIVGAKRCGTTTLQAYIAQHPLVVPPHSGKGTHYFDENYQRGERWFRGHYPLRTTMAWRGRRMPGTAVTGEASPYYCFHPAGFERIAGTLPDARLIFVLRDPVARAFSHYQYERRRGFEPNGIHDALHAESERLAGEEERLLSDPGYVSWPHRHFSYVSRGMYADQLRRCLRFFPREQLLLVRFEEFFADPPARMGEVWSFLGLPPVSGQPVPRLESGNSPPVPEDVAQRLRLAYEEPNRALFEEFGVDYR